MIEQTKARNESEEFYHMLKAKTDKDKIARKQ